MEGQESNGSYQSISQYAVESAVNKDDQLQEQQSENQKKGFIETFRTFNSRQKKLFSSLLLLSLCDAVGFTAITPFFALVTASKGLTELQTGIIFSAYSAAGIISAILTGKWVGKLGVKFCVISGMVWSIGSTGCFGILLHTSPEWFFILSVICRSYMGFGMNVSYTAMFSIIFQEFGNRSVTVISMSEGLLVIGSLVGPLIGGGLYDVGGYFVPFAVLTGLQILLTTCCYIYLPNSQVEPNPASVSPLYLLLSFSGAVCFLTVVGCFMTSSFVTAFLPAYLNQVFGLNALSVAVASLVGALSYSILSPIWGYASDVRPNAYIIEVGLFGMGLGFILFGPPNIIKQLFGWNKQHLWLVYLAEITSGSFFGAALVQTFQLADNGFKDLNLPDTEITKYGLISGLWNMAYSVGDIAGPSIGGVMMAKLKFEDTIGIFGLVLIALVLLHFLLRFVRSRRKIRNEETIEEESSPLLVNQ